MGDGARMVFCCAGSAMGVLINGAILIGGRRGVSDLVV